MLSFRSPKTKDELEMEMEKSETEIPTHERWWILCDVLRTTPKIAAALQWIIIVFWFLHNPQSAFVVVARGRNRR